MLALGETATTIIYIALLLATAYSILSQKKPKIASLDDAMSSVATQGAFIPLIIGRYETGPVICFVEDATGGAAQIVPQNRSLSPGLGSLGTRGSFAKGGGGAPSQPSYFERALHVLAVGPGSILHRIRQNGETIWEGPIDPSTHPSGSILPAGNQSGSEGFFEIHWGFPDDPILTTLQNSKFHGLPVRYSHCMKVLWNPKNLGGARQWPRLDYEVTCPCYSQIASTSTNVPLEGDDSKPSWEDWNAPDAYVPPNPPNTLLTDRMQFFIQATSAQQRAIVLRNGNPALENETMPDLTNYFPAGGICKVRLTSQGANLVDPRFSDPVSWITTQTNVWKYFWIVKSTRMQVEYADPPGANPDYLAQVIYLGPEVDPASLVNQEDTIPRALGLVQLGNVAAVKTSSSDGINPVHMVDQLLFAKYPYGAGKDRSKFDSRSIEVAAEVLQKEKIRGGLRIADGEGVRSVIASICQDIGLAIVWDVQVGKFVFEVIRYEETAVNIPPDAILEPVESMSVQGTRPADVLAFTFKDRERNYRDRPFRVNDSGQISQYENQRSKKIPIEVSQDLDSMTRLLPRRQQEALSNLSVQRFITNHSTVMATPTRRFTAVETEGPGMQFMITEVQRDINSSKTELGTLIDAYNSPNSTPTSSNPQVAMLRAARPSEARPPVLALESFEAIELPRSISRDGVELLFLASRASEQTVQAVVWGSQDDTTFSIVGTCPIVVSGVLTEDLPADGPVRAEGPYTISFGSNVDANATEDLSIDEPAWRSGKQLLIVGDELIFLREATLQQPSSIIAGLIRGRAGTAVSHHPAGTRFYILPASYVLPTVTTLAVPGRPFYFKIQAVTKNRTDDLEGISQKTLSVQGKAFKPGRITALRQASLRPNYSTASDLNLLWGYFSDVYKRTGLGTQLFGQPSGISPPKGYFLVDLNGLKTLETSTASITISPSLRTTLGLDALASWTVTVTHVEGSFQSDPVSLTLVPS